MQNATRCNTLQYGTFYYPIIERPEFSLGPFYLLENCPVLSAPSSSNEIVTAPLNQVPQSCNETVVWVHCVCFPMNEFCKFTLSSGDIASPDPLHSSVYVCWFKGLHSVHDMSAKWGCCVSKNWSSAAVAVSSGNSWSAVPYSLADINFSKDPYVSNLTEMAAESLSMKFGTWVDYQYT